MAIAIDIAFLLVYTLGAFAYGSALTLSMRQAQPIWTNRLRRAGETGQMDAASVALFAWSAAWFVVLGLDQFIDLATNASSRGWLDLLQLLLVFGFPPLIMHTMYQEAHCAVWPDGPAKTWARRVLAAGYVIGVVCLASTLGIVFRWWTVPNADVWIGIAIAATFTMSGAYASLVMARKPRREYSTDGHRLRRVLNGLFVTLALMNFVPAFFSTASISFGTFGKLMSVTPLLFLSATTYYENRFEFYDLLVKRGAMLLATLAALGAYYVVALPILDGLPADGSRPWLFALAAVPLMMAAPRLSRALSQRLDRAWFGRHYTPVTAVTTVLSSLQTATDEPTLIAAAEHSLKEVLGVTVRLTADNVPPDDARTAFRIDGSVADPSLWVIVPNVHGERTLLSEDLTLLRSLGTVVTYLVENVRLQQRRQEQDLLEQELRVQSSQSELKALRAQINPHFLFNALNTVASLIHSNPARADRAVEQLSEVFRHTLRRSDSEWTPLDQELAFATAYLDVEEARFGDRLTYTIDADAEARRALVPAMIVHTLVENAVKHGIAQRRGTGTLAIQATTDGARLTVTVTDNGPGPQHTADAFARARRDGEQFGLRNVRDRLRGHFGDAASFTLTRDDGRGVTIARVELPVVSPEPRAAAAEAARA
ncbi:MAG: histidine kinase [Vicinamibacterales bacterium]